MTKSTLQRWKRNKEFAYAMLNNVLSVLDGLEEPVEFVSALRNQLSGSRQPPAGGPAETLACSISFYRSLSRKQIGEIPYKGEFSDVNGTIN